MTRIGRMDQTRIGVGYSDAGGRRPRLSSLAVGSCWRQYQVLRGIGASTETALARGRKANSASLPLELREEHDV